MRYLTLFITAVSLNCCSNLKSSHPLDNPLIGTKWQFIGFIHSDSVYRYPIEYNFSIEFKSDAQILVMALGDYTGNYKIKSNKIFIETNITVSYSSDLELLHGGAGKALALKRRYQSELMMDKFSYFELNQNELRIDSDWGRMLYRRM